MNLFDIVTPKEDVLAGRMTDNQFAADLSQVLSGTAPEDYKNPARFFHNTYPTQGLKSILSSVGRRLSGLGTQTNSLFRLDTQFGGGKTHSLIALVHAMTQASFIPNLSEFVSISDIPKEEVIVFAFSGENSNPSDGILTNDKDIRPHSIWGELAFALGGKEAYELLINSDLNHTSPGASILERILPKKPVLILIDEIAVYLRKVERAFPGATGQFTSFLQELVKVVSSSEKACLVFTLAITQDKKAKDAYQKEQEAVIKAFEEAQSVAARQVTILNPTDDSETKKVIQRRLFSKIQEDKIDGVIQEYKRVWENNKDQLPTGFSISEYANEFKQSYPFHPALFGTLTEKLSSLDKFQRTRGMLRLLARTVHQLWEDRPSDAKAIHTHHIHLGIETIRDEVTSRLEQGMYTPALKADVTAVENDQLSTAQNLDKELFYGDAPLTEYIARTIFLNSMAFPDSAKGIYVPELKQSIYFPGCDASLFEKARTKFIENSQYLDDRPNSPMRFLANPNLEQVIRRHMREFDGTEVYKYFKAKTEEIFNGSSFKLGFEPMGANSIPDDAGDGKPYLIVFSTSQLTVESDQASLPDLIEKIFKFKGHDQSIRLFQNNLVFLAAQSNSVNHIEEKARRRLALEKLRKPESLNTFPDHQKNKIQEDYKKSEFELATALAEGYRHLYYPSHNKTHTFTVQLKHILIEKPTSANRPGDGQFQVLETLRRENKIQEEGSIGDSPTYVESKIFGGRNEISLQGLKNEFRKSPYLSMLFSDSPLINMVQNGIRSGVFIYQLGEQLWGQGDPAPNIQISENAFAMKMSYALEKGIWPRPAPLEVTIRIENRNINGQVQLLVSVSGGVMPYTYTSDNISELRQFGPTSQTATRVLVAASATVYQVKVIDSRGTSQSASLLVEEERDQIRPPIPPVLTPIPEPPKEKIFISEGPLVLALESLWTKLREAKIKSISKVRIKTYDSTSVSKIQQGAINYNLATKTISYNGKISTTSIPDFSVNYSGDVGKFSSIRNFFESQIRSLGGESSVEGEFQFEFNEPMKLSDSNPENFAKELSSYGGAEVYIEAEVKE